MAVHDPCVSATVSLEVSLPTAENPGSEIVSGYNQLSLPSRGNGCKASSRSEQGEAARRDVEPLACHQIK